MDGTLDIALLRTFVAISDHGGFGRAAVALQRSQPTVSQHVRTLERRLGRPLVEKDGRGARFTATGERLLVEARRIIAAHDGALARLDGAMAETGDEPAADVSGFLRYVVARTPQLLSEWERSSRGE